LGRFKFFILAVLWILYHSYKSISWIKCGWFWNGRAIKNGKI